MTTDNTEREELELLPCPLCDSTDLLLRDVAGWELDCRGCGLSLVLADDPSREGLVARWNARAAVAAPQRDERLNDYVTLLERNNGQLRAVLKQALDQTGCDGDLCNYRWHERARVLLGEETPPFPVSTPVSTPEPHCWHCGVVLAFVPKLRCEDCPDECDTEDCDEMGCAATSTTAVDPSPAAPSLIAEQERPKIVCLCGSTKFMEAYQEANLRETLAGHIVLSVGTNTRSDAELTRQNYFADPSIKRRLDALHFRKIEMADEIFVVNVGGYIGESTRNEISHAKSLGKPIRWLEPLAQEPVMPATTPPTATAAEQPEVLPVPAIVHPFGPCGYKFCDWPDGELRCNEPRAVAATSRAREAALEIAQVYADEPNAPNIEAIISKHFPSAVPVEEQPEDEIQVETSTPLGGEYGGIESDRKD